MNNNVIDINSIGAKLKIFYMQKNNLNNNHFLDFRKMIPEMKKQMILAAKNLKESSYNNPKLYYRLKSASDEIKLIANSTDKNFNENITNLCRTIDIMNNIGHVYQEIGNRSLAKNFMFAKAVSIQKLGKECLQQKGQNKNDIVIGLCRDNTKKRNKNGLVIDLPGVGQVSWHTTNDVAEVLKGAGIKKYPYEFAKNSSLTNYNLFKFDKLNPKKYKLNKHQMIVRSNSTNIRKSLYKHYKNNYRNKGLLMEQPSKQVYINKYNKIPIKPQLKSMAAKRRGQNPTNVYNIINYLARDYRNSHNYIDSAR